MCFWLSEGRRRSKGVINPKWLAHTWWYAWYSRRSRDCERKSHPGRVYAWRAAQEMWVLSFPRPGVSIQTRHLPCSSDSSPSCFLLAEGFVFAASFIMVASESPESRSLCFLSGKRGPAWSSQAQLKPDNPVILPDRGRRQLPALVTGIRCSWTWTSGFAKWHVWGRHCSELEGGIAAGLVWSPGLEC